MRLDTPYYPIPDPHPQGTFGAVMEILLKSRLKLGLDKEEETTHTCDDDVNAYLAGVLVSYIDPIYLAYVAEVVSQYDFDIVKAVEHAQDRVAVYRIYKVNADDLLVHLGLFSRVWREEQGRVGRMRQYYTMASQYQRRIYGRMTAVGEVQTKLAIGPERYLDILTQARSDYLHLMDKMGSKEFAEFKRKMEEYEKRLPIQSKQDELLDAFSACLKDPTNLELRERLMTLIKEMQRLDPTFHAEFILKRIPPPL